MCDYEFRTNKNSLRCEPPRRFFVAICNRIAGRWTESVVKPNKEQDVRINSWINHETYYEGVGTIKYLSMKLKRSYVTYNTGGRQPYMWWVKFETKITNAYAIIKFKL